MEKKIREVKYPKELEEMDKRNYEYKILIMLKNNDFCLWGDFRTDSLSIPESSLNNTLKLMQTRGHLIKAPKRRYEITEAGEIRIKEIKSFDKQIIYPSEELLIKMSKEHKILWMVINNEYCQWGDLDDKRLGLSKGSLSTYRKRLIDKEMIEPIIVRGLRYTVYKPKPEGKREYTRMLKLYEYDPETIRKEQVKRFREISKENEYFFKEHNIDDFQVKYRFKKYRMLLDYSEYRKVFRIQEPYNLMLLYLSINHPDNHSKNVNEYWCNAVEFCNLYNIEINYLNYYIQEALNEDLSGIKIFSLQLDKDVFLYFHDKEKLGKILKAIIEEYFEENIKIVITDTAVEKEIKTSFTERDIEAITYLVIEKHKLFERELK